MSEIVTIAICAAVIVAAICLTIVVLRVTDRQNPRAFTLKGWGKEMVIAPPNEKVEVAIVNTDAEPATRALALVSPDEPEGDAPQESQASALWTTSDLKELQTAWEAFRNEDLFSSNIEFWTTFYYGRRFSLGDGAAPNELQRLSEANQSWVWPLIELAKIAVSQADWNRADQLYEQALARDHDNTPLVYTRMIDVAMRRGGYDAAYQRTIDLLKVAPLKHKGAVVLAMVTAAEGDQYELSRQLMREIAARYSPTQATRFDMAYAYAEKPDTSVIAFRHYAKMAMDGLSAVNVGNNLAVLYGKLGHPRLSIDGYEMSASAGNALSVCNLAHELIDAGFIGRAEQLLGGHASYDGHEENRATVDAKLILAKKTLIENKDAVREDTVPAFNAYQEFVNEVEQSWLTLAPLKAGRYTDGDDFSADISESVAAVSLPIDGASYTGRLVLRGPIYEGTVSLPGATILGGVTRRCVLTAIPGHRVKILVLHFGISTAVPMTRIASLQS